MIGPVKRDAPSYVGQCHIIPLFLGESKSAATLQSLMFESCVFKKGISPVDVVSRNSEKTV